MRTEPPSRLLASLPVSTALRRGGRTRFAPLWTPQGNRGNAARRHGKLQNSLFERLEALLFVQQLLLHAGEVPLQLVHLRRGRDRVGLETKPPGPKRLTSLKVAHKYGV